MIIIMIFLSLCIKVKYNQKVNRTWCLSSVPLIGNADEKNSPSTCCEVFNGLTDHRHLQRCLQFSLFLTIYIINIPSIVTTFVSVMNFELFLFLCVAFDFEQQPLADILLHIRV